MAGTDPTGISSVVGGVEQLAAVAKEGETYGASAGQIEGATIGATTGIVSGITTAATTVASIAGVSIGAEAAAALGIGAAIGNAIPIPLLGAAIGAIIGAFTGLGIWLSSIGHQPATNLIASTPEQARQLLDMFRIDPVLLFQFWDQVGRSKIDPASPDTWPAGTQMADPQGRIWTKRDDARWVVTRKTRPGDQVMADPFDAARKANPAAPPYGWLDSQNQAHYGGKLLAVQPGGWDPASEDLRLSPADLESKFTWVFSQIVILIRELRIAAGDCSPSMAKAGVNCTPYQDNTAKAPLAHPITVFDSWYWDPFKGNQALGRTASDPIESYVFWSGVDVDEPLTSLAVLAKLYWSWIRNKHVSPEIRSPAAAKRALKILRTGLRSSMTYTDTSGNKQPVVFDQGFRDEIKAARALAGETGPDASLAKIVGGNVTPDILSLTPAQRLAAKLVGKRFVTSAGLPGTIDRHGAFHIEPVAELTPKERVIAGYVNKRVEIAGHEGHIDAHGAFVADTKTASHVTAKESVPASPASVQKASVPVSSAPTAPGMTGYLVLGGVAVFTLGAFVWLLKKESTS